MSEARLYQKRKKEHGVALLMALSIFTIVTFVVMQLSRETLTESVLASQGMRKLKSYYSAKAGFEFSLVRIQAFRQAKAQLSQIGDAAGNFDQQLRLIWQFPFAWPPELPGEASAVAKSEVDKILKESYIKDLTFFPEISDPSEKIDLNSLGSPIESIAERTTLNLVESFTKMLETDEELSSEHSIDSITEVLNNVGDWVDPDDESRNGGGEANLYTGENQVGYPRNSSFMDMTELLLVHNMDQLIYKRLKKLTTIQGTFGVNVNTATVDTLIGLDPQFDADTARDFIERRTEIQNSGGQLDRAQFDSLIEELGFDAQTFNEEGIPIVFEPQSSFFIESIGESGNVKTTITAYVIDTEALKEIFISQLDESDKDDGDGDSDGTGGTDPDESSGSGKKVDPPKGRPFVTSLKVK